ncbi:type II toxin-antitoxin system RelE/ParE family toxin [Mucilaginibacter robiniae]|uniref:type II toxin-antitoxin system RelE/ParE family toxin n=1 Tax=Mucilaginibacter robiniae TaxID=2728022 RepID=UPI002006DEB1|nr:type II toxin-antitoxin system RelE/ParE family toxin [Mucilaginibacter robiniae]
MVKIAKVRLAISSKGKGKSGGARVITNFAITDHTVYLLSIYDKAEKESLSNEELADLLKYLLD